MIKAILVAAVCCLSLPAQTLKFAIYGNSGVTAVAPLPAAYQFESTAMGSANSVVVGVTNAGPSAVEIATIYIGATPGAATINANYTVTGLDVSHMLAPGHIEYFTINFTPAGTGQLFGYLQAVYIVQQSGCGLESTVTPPVPQCPATVQDVSTLEGTSTPAPLLLTYNKGAGNVMLLPSAASRLDFGSVSVSATSSITFTLVNQTSSPMAAPAVSLQTGVFASNAFSLDQTALPAMLPANASGSFTVTFAPGQIGNTTATLLVGTNSYGIQGFGIVVNSIDALAVTYVDSTGVRTLPQGGTAISFGQLVPGTAGGATLKFTVTNPQTSFDAVTLPNLSVTGSAYTLSGAPPLPVSIQPNSSITFSITFNAAASGTFTGSLALGTRAFLLSGLSVISPVPAMSLQVSGGPLTSAQQVTLTVQAASASPQNAIGELTMQFVPAVANITDDPAVMFLATSGRDMQLELAQGSQNATYKGAASIGFQTGTTAGVLTFTLTFPNTPPLSKSFTITPALIFLSSAEAARQEPSVIITVNGYDNTYSAGKMSFAFFDLKGLPINTAPMPVDATTDFHQYFFTNDVAGGSFAMQADFPIKGDITQIGSVTVTMTNSAGQTTTKLALQ